MRIESLHIRNYRLLKDVNITNIPGFCVIIGVNGTGKSTFLDALCFMKDCLFSNVNEAVQSRGGFSALRRRGAEGENIQMENWLWVDISGNPQPVTYHVEIGEENGRVRILHDTVQGLEQIERIQIASMIGSVQEDWDLSGVSANMIDSLDHLGDTQPGQVLFIESPERHLYPRLLEPLVEKLRDYANRCGQVIISTYSPVLLNAVHVDEVLLFVKENGYSRVLRASDNEQVVACVNEGEKLGDLWMQGIFDEM